MKIASLKLKAFGPFTDRELDLSAGHQGFHLIYGLNEAGKSSALQAIHDLLYGIDVRSEFDFVHPYREMRLGGALQSSSGETLEFVRRKGSKATIRDRDDRDALDDDVLARFLGDVDDRLFTSLFGIDHQRLRQGGEEILRGDGHVGALLFAAAGVADLRSYEQQLQKESQNLFAARAKNPLMNTTLRLLREAADDQKRLQVSAETWQAHADRFQELQQRCSELDEQLHRDRAEHGRLSRIRQALAGISQWKETVEELRQVGQAVLLPEDFGGRREAAFLQLRTASLQQEEAEKQIQHLRSGLDGLEISPIPPDEAEVIEDLHRRLEVYRTGLADRPELALQQRLAEDRAREILQSLGRPPDLSDVERLHVPTDQRIRTQNLAAEHERLAERERTITRNRQQLMVSVADIETERQQLGAPRDATALGMIVARVQEAGDLEARRDQLQDEMERLEADARVQLQQFGLWSGSWEECEGLPLPVDETVDGYEATLEKLAHDLAAARHDAEELQDTQQQVRRQLQELDREGAIPTESDLRAARRLRDEGWELIAALLRGNRNDARQEAAWLRRFSQTTDVTTAFRQSVDAADEIVDRMRLQAELVAQKQLLEAQVSELDEQLGKAAKRQAGLQQQIQESESAWRTHWQPAGIEPLTPREMRGWLRKHEKLVQSFRDVRRLRTDRDQLERRIAHAQSELGRGLSNGAEGAEAAPRSLRQQLQLAQRQLSDLEQQRAEHKRLSDLQHAQRRGLDEAERQWAGLQQDWTVWREAWTACMERLGLDSDATPGEATSVLQHLLDLFQHGQEARQHSRHVEEIDRYAREYEAEVGKVAQRLAPDLSGDAAVQIVRGMVARLARARQLAQERESLERQLAEQQERLERAQEAVGLATAEMQALCDQAGCTDSADLREAEVRSGRRRALEADQQRLKEHLCSLSAGQKLEEFLAEASSENPDALPLRLQEVTRGIDALEAQRDALVRDVERARLEFQAIDGSDAAAVRAEECEILKAELTAQVRELTVLRVASGALRLGIDRYRERHQGPVLERASQLFAALTLGSFEGLRVDVDESGQPELLGVRPDGLKVVRVSGMSDGTCDQLYLALRLASIDNWLRHHEPLPLIVDDIFVHFDDGRAAAALQVLADLSRRTQVICFTHHAHLAEMARGLLPADTLFVHQLSDQ